MKTKKNNKPVLIKKEEKLYTKQEIIDLLTKIVDECDGNNNFTEQWIKDNLK